MIRVTNEIKSSNIYDNLKTNPTADPNFNYDIIYMNKLHVLKLYICRAS